MTPVEPREHLYGAPPEYRIFDEIDDGILVVGEDCTVVWANPAFRRMLGVPEGEPGEVPEMIPCGTRGQHPGVRVPA